MSFSLRSFSLCPCLSVAVLLLAAGCPEPTAPKTVNEQPAPAAPAEPAPAPQPAEKVPITKRRTSEIVEKNAAMDENPNYIVKDNKVEGFDPMSVAFTGYLSAASRANVAALKHNMDLIKASEERHLTYQELKEYMQQNNITMNALPVYQTYAYDEKTGEFMVLEDTKAKAEFKEEALK